MNEWFMSSFSGGCSDTILHSTSSSTSSVLHVSDKSRTALPEPPLTSLNRPTNFSSLHHSPTTQELKLLPIQQSYCRFKIQLNSSPPQTAQHTNNIIYLIITMYGLEKEKQQIDQISQTLRLRFTNHKFEISINRDTPAVRHINPTEHSPGDVNIIAIDCLPTSDNISFVNKE